MAWCKSTLWRWTYPHTHTHINTNGVLASQIERDTPLSFSSIPQGNHTLTPLSSLFFYPLPRLFSFFSAFYSPLYSSLHSLMLYYHKGRTANWMDRERIALKHTNNQKHIEILKGKWRLKRKCTFITRVTASISLSILSYLSIVSIYLSIYLYHSDIGLSVGWKVHIWIFKLSRIRRSWSRW